MDGAPSGYHVLVRPQLGGHDGALARLLLRTKVRSALTFDSMKAIMHSSCAGPVRFKGLHAIAAKHPSVTNACICIRLVHALLRYLTHWTDAHVQAEIHDFKPNPLVDESVMRVFSEFNTGNRLPKLKVTN